MRIDNVYCECLNENSKLNRFFFLLTSTDTSRVISSQYKPYCNTDKPRLPRNIFWKQIKWFVPRIVLSKLFSRVLILRIHDGVESQLREEQAGFRKERSTAEQLLVFTLRNIIDLCTEWCTALFVNYVDSGPLMRVQYPKCAYGPYC